MARQIARVTSLNPGGTPGAITPKLTVSVGPGGVTRFVNSGQLAAFVKTNKLAVQWDSLLPGEALSSLAYESSQYGSTTYVESHLNAGVSVASDLLGSDAVSSASTGMPDAIKTRWGNLIAETRLHSGGLTDINAFVQAVLRESYMQTTLDLYFYAEKVKFYNNVKKQIREELTRARKVLAGVAGLDGDQRMGEVYVPKNINMEYTGGTDVTTTQAPIPEDKLFQIGELEISLPPEIYQRPGFEEAIPLTEELDGITLAPASCGGSAAVNNGLIHNFYYFLALNSVLAKGGAGNKITADEIKEALASQFGLDAEIGVSDDNRLTVTLADGTIVTDAQGDGAIVLKDVEFSKMATAASDVLGIDVNAMIAEAETGDTLFMDTAYPEISTLLMNNDLAGSDGNEKLVEILLVAKALEVGGAQGAGIDTKAELEAYIQGLEEDLATVGDDAQLANVDLQNMLQKQQQTIQMMSNIAKMLHDTALSVIRKIGG